MTRQKNVDVRKIVSYKMRIVRLFLSKINFVSTGHAEESSHVINRYVRYAAPALCIKLILRFKLTDDRFRC